MNLLPGDNSLSVKHCSAVRLYCLSHERGTRRCTCARYINMDGSVCGEHFREDGINSTDAIIRRRSRVRCADLGGARCGYAAEGPATGGRDDLQLERLLCRYPGRVRVGNE